MQTQSSFLDELKSMYRRNMFMKLIFINVAIYLVLQMLIVFSELSETNVAFWKYITYTVGLPTQMGDFIRQPWSLFTSMFTHYTFFHILMNMIMLFFVGRLFEQIYTGKRLLYTYLLGGIFGGVVELLAHQIFPSLLGQNVLVVGASGSVMALFILLAFSQPNIKVALPFFPPFRIIWLAIAYIGLDLLQLSSQDGTAHFAHLGGAIIGLIGAQHPNSSSNIIVATQNGMESFFNLFRRKKRPKLTVKHGRDVRTMSDEEYNANAKLRQDQMNQILDKISKSGYESLSKKEKDFLFNQSKK